MRMWQCYLRIAVRARSASGLLDALGLGYDLPVGQAVYAIDAFPDGRSALAYRMDRRRWLQYERSQRAPDRCLFGAAPQRREEPAQRTSAFLSSREENGEDRCWSAALRLDRFRLAEAPARAERTETLARIVCGAGFPLILLLKHCRFTSSTTASGTDAGPGVQAETRWDP